MWTVLSSKQLHRSAPPFRARQAKTLAAPAFLLPPTGPTHYDKYKRKTQIPASDSGDAGRHKDKGMELLHRAPALSLWLVLPLLHKAPGPALQMLLQKRQLLECLELRDCALPASWVSQGFQRGIRPGARGQPSPLADPSSPRTLQSAWSFPLTSRRPRHNIEERP